MGNLVYLLGAAVQVVGLAYGADYRAIGATLIILGVFTYVRFYLQ